MFLEKEKIKNWRIFGNEESEIIIDVFGERGNKELESLWK